LAWLGGSGDINQASEEGGLGDWFVRVVVEKSVAVH